MFFDIETRFKPRIRKVGALWFCSTWDNKNIGMGSTPWESYFVLKMGIRQKNLIDEGVAALTKR